MRIETELTEEQLKRVITLRAEGKTLQDISDILNSDYQKLFSTNELSEYLNKRRNNAVKVMKEKGRLDEKLAEQYFDTIADLKSLHTAVWEEFMTIKESPEYKQATVICEHCSHPVKVRFKSSAELIKAADHLLKQIAHVDQVLGKVQKSATTNITYNVTDITQKIVKVMPQILESWESQGLIRIKNKKRLRELTEEEPNVD